MRLPQFTIRDLMWATVVVALAIGWLLDHAKTRVDWREVGIREAELREETKVEKRRADKATEAVQLYRHIFETERLRPPAESASSSPRPNNP
jgi:hypothetical protein